MSPRLRMLLVFVGREFREQYAGSLLGSAWGLIQPLTMILVYWFVFGVVWDLRLPEPRTGGGDLPFIVFLLSAMLPWLAFNDALNKAAGAVIARAEVVRHGAFPVGIFPVARLLAAHLIFVPLIVLFALGMQLGGRPLDPSAWLALGVLLVFQLGLAWGAGLLLAAISVYVRDVGHALTLLLMAMFFTAPILYPLTQVPEAMVSWMWINPFTAFAEGYHQILLNGRWPDARVWALAVLWVAVVGLAGRWVFARLRPGFADAL